MDVIGERGEEGREGGGEREVGGKEGRREVCVCVFLRLCPIHTHVLVL